MMPRYTSFHRSVAQVVTGHNRMIYDDLSANMVFYTLHSTQAGPYRAPKISATNGTPSLYLLYAIVN